MLSCFDVSCFQHSNKVRKSQFPKTDHPGFHRTCNILQASTTNKSPPFSVLSCPGCKYNFALVVAWRYRPALGCLRFRWNLPWDAMENWTYGCVLMILGASLLSFPVVCKNIGEFSFFFAGHHDLYPRQIVKKYTNMSIQASLNLLQSILASSWMEIPAFWIELKKAWLWMVNDSGLQQY